MSRSTSKMRVVSDSRLGISPSEARAGSRAGAARPGRTQLPSDRHPVPFRDVRLWLVARRCCCWRPGSASEGKLTPDAEARRTPLSRTGQESAEPAGSSPITGVHLVTPPLLLPQDPRLPRRGGSRLRRPTVRGAIGPAVAGHRPAPSGGAVQAASRGFTDLAGADFRGSETIGAGGPCRVTSCSETRGRPKPSNTLSKSYAK